MALDFTRYRGLTSAEVAKRQEKSGLNILFTKRQKGFLHYAMRIFEEPMLLLLLITAILYYAIGNAWDGSLMIMGVLVMIGIDIYQEAKTDRALEALKELSTPKITVIRNGRLQTVNNEELVAGDILIAREGERVAGDGTILECSNFSVDESMLTGETGAIFKTHNEKRITEDRRTGKRIPDSKSQISSSSQVFAGTLVLSGQAIIRVTSTGPSTQYGRIGQFLVQTEEQPTLLQIKTGRLVKIFGLVGLASCLALFFINYAAGHQFVNSLLKGLTLAISVIPEEIPVILTVFAALGAYRLSKKNSLIRKISIVETLGGITTLCTDKTGTLTQNKMELHTLLTDHDPIKVSRLDKRREDHLAILRCAVLTCQPEPFDPADISIFGNARRIGIDTDEMQRSYALIREYGFDQHLRAMGYAWRKDGSTILAIKGSPEQIIEHCALSASKRLGLSTQIDKLSSQGLRVLALACQELPDGHAPPSLANLKGLKFVSLLGFHDPPKPEAKQAVQACQRAGITVRMITGDHPQTALHIAEAVGIKHRQHVINGAEIEALSEDELAKRIKNTYVFARVVPEQKLKIVHALQRLGEVVAMIGDGVNDAPSLKEANVGIAMGQQGTNVAREAADMILLDDRLGTVVNAIQDGRRIFDNIQKGVSYIFGVHVYVILIALSIPLMGLPALLLPIHIVLLELIIDPTCSLVFEAIPAEADLMLRKPRNPNDPLISSDGFLRIFLKSLSIFALTAAAYLVALHLGFSTEAARTLGFSVMLWSNLFNVLSLVSRVRPTYQSLGFLKNRSFLAVYAIMLISFAGIVYLPTLNLRLGLTALPVQLFLLTIIIGFLPTLGSDVYKKMKAI